MDNHPGLANGPIYLDYNGTTPVDPRVVEAMLPYLSTYFGNPSSSHRYGAVPVTQAATHLAKAVREVGVTDGCA